MCVCVKRDSRVLLRCNIYFPAQMLHWYRCRCRSNQDKTKCDLYGSNLLQLCKTAGICIFNGRVTGDEEGSHTTSKCTTIDYLVGSPSVLPFVKSMQVEDFDQIYSDIHNKIIVTFNTKHLIEKRYQQSQKLVKSTNGQR